MAASPKLSLIMTTYNRAHLMPRAIDSLLKQDWQDWELIVVDDGSTDNTQEVLSRYTDPRIRLFTHEANRGVNPAKNTGFDAIRGEWFTLLDSDDEILGTHALSTLMEVPRRVNPTINAVTCNCLDFSTGELAGTGVDGDQYLDWKTILMRCRGEFWGITKTELLGSSRLDERVRGFENVLWHEINRKATRYYIHQPLRVWHTEGDDRVCKEVVDDSEKSERIYHSFCALLHHRQYLKDLKQYGPDKYWRLMYTAGMSFVENGDRRRARQALGNLLTCQCAYLRSVILAVALVAGPGAMRQLRMLKRAVSRPEAA